jgi:hypothetical protein
MKTESPQLKEALDRWVEMLEPAVKAMFESIDVLPNAIIEPRTYLHNIDKMSDQAGERIEINNSKLSYDNFEELVRDSFSNKEFIEIAKEIQDKFLQEFGHSPAFASLKKLVWDASCVSGQECFQALKKIDRAKLDKNLLLTESKFHYTNESTGEARAELATQVFKLLSETIYQPFLRTLLRLCRLTKGAQAKQNIDKLEYGNVLNELFGHSFDSMYPYLIVPECVLFRNSEAHVDWDYYPDKDEIEFRDRNKPPKRLTVAEVIKLARQMEELAGQLLPKFSVAIQIAELRYRLEKNPTLLQDFAEQVLSKIRAILSQSENCEE